MRKRSFVIVPLRAAAWAALLLALAAGGGALYLHKRPPREPARAALEAALSRFLERPVTIASVAWGYAPPGLVGRDLRLLQSDGREMASCGKVRVSLSWRSLGRGRVEADKITFLSPRMTLRWGPDGDTDLSRMIRQVHGRMRAGAGLARDAAPVAFHRFEIRSGRLTLVDEARSTAPFATSLLLDADGRLEGEAGRRSFPFELRARVEAGKASGPLLLRGRLGEGEAVRVESEGLPLAVFADRAPWLAPWEGRVVFSGGWDLADREGRAAGRLFARPAAGEQDLWVTGDFSYQNRSTSTASLTLTDAGTDARLDVSLSPPPDRAVQLVFISSGSDLGRLSRQWARVRPPAAPAAPAAPPFPSTGPAAAAPARPLPPWRVEAFVNVRNAVLEGETLETFAVSAARQTGGPLVVRRLDARAFGGSLTAGATFYAAPDGSPRFGVSWTLDGLDTARLLAVVGAKPVFSGVGASTGALDGPWPVGDWSGMDGAVSFDVRDGAVRGLPGLITSFSRLNLASIFSRKDPGGGLPFDRASGRFSMAGGVLVFDEPALFENKTLQVAFSGRVDVARREVDAAMVLHFLTFLGEVVRAVPGLGAVLMGGKKSLFPVVVRLKGPLAAPEIDYQAARSLLAPLWSPFRRPAPRKTEP